jgi:hypothetical protein
MPELHLALKKKKLQILFGLCRDVRNEEHDRSLPYALSFVVRTYSCSTIQCAKICAGQKHFDKTQELDQL